MRPGRAVGLQAQTHALVHVLVSMRPGRAVGLQAQTHALAHALVWWRICQAEREQTTEEEQEQNQMS